MTMGVGSMASEIDGTLHVANDVLADIVGNAAMECYGIVGMTAIASANIDNREQVQNCLKKISSICRR